jgi:uncharacterized protein YjiS (DUF1127 family)
MPPQPTNVTTGATNGAARLRFETSIFSSLIKRWRRAIQSWSPGNGATASFQNLSDRQLMDIGLTRGDVDAINPDRAVDRIRERAVDLWSRGGM